MIGCLETTRAITDCYKYTPALSQEIKLTITNYLDDLKTVEEFWNLWKTQTWYLFLYKNFEKRAYNSLTPGLGLTKESWMSTLHRDHLQQVSLGWLVKTNVEKVWDKIYMDALEFPNKGHFSETARPCLTQ